MKSCTQTAEISESNIMIKEFEGNQIVLAMGMILSQDLSGKLARIKEAR